MIKKLTVLSARFGVVLAERGPHLAVCKSWCCQLCSKIFPRSQKDIHLTVCEWWKCSRFKKKFSRDEMPFVKAGRVPFARKYSFTAKKKHILPSANGGNVLTAGKTSPVAKKMYILPSAKAGTVLAA